MITKDIAVSVRGHLYHVTARNADGTALRAKVNGRCQTWVTKPDDFKLPVKHGLKNCFYITPSNASEWLTEDPTLPRVEPTIPDKLYPKGMDGNEELNRLSEEQARDLGEPLSPFEFNSLYGGPQ